MIDFKMIDFMMSLHLQQGKEIAVSTEKEQIYSVKKFPCIKFGEWIHKDHFTYLQDKELEKVKKKFIAIQKDGFDSSSDKEVRLDKHSSRKNLTTPYPYPEHIKTAIESELSDQLKLHFGIDVNNNLYLIYVHREQLIENMR